MFWWNKNSNNKHNLELENFIKNEFLMKENFTFWEKKTFKKLRIINLILKNKVFTGLFFCLQTVFIRLQTNKQFPKILIEFYFQYFVLNDFFLTFGKQKFHKPKNWNVYVEEIRQKNLILKKELFFDNKIQWIEQTPIIHDPKIKDSIYLIDDNLCILFGNLLQYLFITSENWKSNDLNEIKTQSFNLGYFLSSYLLTHYSLRQITPWQKHHQKISMILKTNNILFYSKMYYAKQYIECLQFFFPETFNYSIKEINKIIGQ